MKPLRLRFKPRYTNILLAIILLCIGLSLYNLLPTGYNLFEGHTVSGPTTYIDDTIMPPPADFSDSLMTYAHFATIEQEAKNRKNREDMSDKGFGNKLETFFLGVSDISECDTCSLRNQGFQEFKTTRYYLSLPGYSLQPEETFQYRQGKYYLKYEVIDRVKKEKGEIADIYGHYERKEVRFRFSNALPEDQTNILKGSVLIPVGKKTHDAVKMFVLTFSVLLVPALLYIFLALPAKILLRIARGEVFSTRNIRYLHIMGWTCLGFILAVPLFRYIFRFLFRHYLTGDLHLSFWEGSTNVWSAFISAAITFAIAKAFKRGYKLQKEQELTV